MVLAKYYRIFIGAQLFYFYVFVYVHKLQYTKPHTSKAHVRFHLCGLILQPCHTITFTHLTFNYYILFIQYMPSKSHFMHIYFFPKYQIQLANSQ